jgi:hypothetical protein
MNESRLSALLLALAALLAAASPSSAQSNFRDKPQGYVRIDTNLRDNQFWLGGALPLGPIDLQGDLILEGRRLQGDVGVAFYVGSLALLPMVGISYDFGPHEVDRLIVPRLFSVLEAGPIYLESWLELTFRDVVNDGARDDFYTRDFLLFTVHEQLAIGPQVEVRYALRHGPDKRLVNLPVGGQISTRWGGSTFAVFLGYELAKYSRRDGDGVTGRFTFVRSWQ